ncbi:hypothetical protein [Rathayibacter soli]|uniref:hypothetical protein n=1 Tax=Rathayibacter soli TaxID=3144168 RepID=UPI0027E58AE2|nr:hypothetical protein [Glaciibacter superstes]
MSENDPIAYTALTKGTRVDSASGSKLGTVEHVLADAELDLFDGIVLRTGSGLRFVDARQIETITTAVVHTTITDDRAADLPKPDGDAVFEADPEEFTGSRLTERFGRMFLREHWMRDRD